MVDVLGLILAVAVTGANVQDRDGGQLVLKGLKDRFPRLARVWADGVYSGRLVEWAEKTAQFVLDIVCKPRGQIGFSVLPWRWIVERTFAWLGNYRRLSLIHSQQFQSLQERDATSGDWLPNRRV